MAVSDDHRVELPDPEADIEAMTHGRIWDTGEEHRMPEIDLLHTFDGSVWAKEFCRITGFQDEAWALTWFCNAIMAGYDEAKRQHAAGPRREQEIRDLREDHQEARDEIRALDAKLAASEQRVRELENAARMLLKEFKEDITGEYSSPASREFQRLLASPGSPQE